MLPFLKTKTSLTGAQKKMAKNYIEAFIFPVPRKHLKTYQAVAKKSAKAWMKYGALDYVEAVANDAPKGKVTSFPRSVKLKTGEIVVLGHVVYKSRAHRDQVMKKIMADEAMMKTWENLPVDGMRMIFGGFKVFVTK
jgi:uncharacterized protein YbaA (DUF1428 family)